MNEANQTSGSRPADPGAIHSHSIAEIPVILLIWQVSSPVVDGLRGFPDAIIAVFLEATVQACSVHLLRNSMDFVSWKDRKPLATALKGIYAAVDATAAEAALTAFEASHWGSVIPRSASCWSSSASCR